MSTQMIEVPHTALHLHPENMRRTYEGIEELAQSIAEQGVLEPLIVVEEAGRLVVVDGNRRLKALERLGDAAPPAPCRLVEMTRREQFLAMATTFLQRQDVDPISEALHYRRLVEEEGETRVSLARQLGINAARIANRLKLLELDEAIQDLVAGGRLHRDHRLAEALLEIEDEAQRVELARQLASKKISLKGSIAACERLNRRLAERETEARVEKVVKRSYVRDAQPGRSNGHGPAVALAGSDLPENGAALPVDVIRDAARQTCAACDEYARLQAAEPAWAVVVHAADATCEVCGMHEVRGACLACAVPGLVRRILTYSRIGVADEPRR